MSTPATESKRAQTVYTDVTMQDGTVVQFPGKRTILKSGMVNGDGNVALRLDYISGAFQTFVFPGRVGTEDKTLQQLIILGAKQKFADEMADAEDEDSAMEAAEALAERLAKNEWRESAGESVKGAHVVIRAMAEVTSKSRQEVRDYLDGLLAKYEAAGQKVSRTRLYAEIEKNPKYAAKVAELKAKTAAKSKKPAVEIDLGDLA